MLRVKNGIALERGLAAIARRLGWREALFEPRTDREVKINPALAARMRHSSLVDRLVKEMMPDQFVLERREGMFGIADVAAMDPRPIHEVGATLPAFAVIFGRHFSVNLKAMQIIAAIRRGTANFERWRLLKFSHDDPH